MMREYFKIELLEMTQANRDQGISNILAGLLCAFQIMEVGAGTVFNVDEKDLPMHCMLCCKEFLSSQDTRVWN